MVVFVNYIYLSKVESYKLTIRFFLDFFVRSIRESEWTNKKGRFLSSGLQGTYWKKMKSYRLKIHL